MSPSLSSGGNVLSFQWKITADVSYLSARFIQVGQDQKEGIHRCNKEEASICFMRKEKQEWEITE